MFKSYLIFHFTIKQKMGLLHKQVNEFIFYSILHFHSKIEYDRIKLNFIDKLLDVKINK